MTTQEVQHIWEQHEAAEQAFKGFQRVQEAFRKLDALGVPVEKRMRQNVNKYTRTMKSSSREKLNLVNRMGGEPQVGNGVRKVGSISTGATPEKVAH